MWIWFWITWGMLVHTGDAWWYEMIWLCGTCIWIYDSYIVNSFQPWKVLVNSFETYFKNIHGKRVAYVLIIHASLGLCNFSTFQATRSRITWHPCVVEDCRYAIDRRLIRCCTLATLLTRVYLVCELCNLYTALRCTYDWDPDQSHIIILHV